MNNNVLFYHEIILTDILNSDFIKLLRDKTVSLYTIKKGEFTLKKSKILFLMLSLTLVLALTVVLSACATNAITIIDPVTPEEIPVYTNNIPSSEENTHMLFYRPKSGCVADVIPFWDEGKFRLFYLNGITSDGAFGCSWFLVSTADFLNFEEMGVSLAHGGEDDLDLSAITGSVIKVDDTYHIFYTGHNPALIPTQLVMHAVSTDLMNWEKIPEDNFFPNPEKYETGKNNNFRDPFVYYSDDENKYYMLLSVREKSSPTESGYTALFSSTDLKTWTDEGKFWAPELYHTHECPDLFKIGDWWYLVYSEYTGTNMTRYVMSKDLKNWVFPKDDAFDGRAFYAAKSYSNGKNRYLFGWVPTKVDGNDENRWEWGGSMMVHQIFQRADGTLGVKLPQTINDAWQSLEKSEEKITVSNSGGKASKLLFTALSDAYRIDGTMTFEQGCKEFGITFGQNYSSKSGGYKYSFHPDENAVKFDGVTSDIYSKNLSRPIDLLANATVNFSLLVENQVAVLYINDEIALSTRFHNPLGGDITIYAVGGEASMENAVISSFTS